MDGAQTDDLTRLAEAATPLQVRAPGALIGPALGQTIMPTDLALRIGDDDLGLSADGSLVPRSGCKQRGLYFVAAG